MQLLWAILGALSLALTLTLNYLASALPLGGRTTGEISDSFPVLFTPAGYVFAIWGVIYLGLTAWTVYQLLPAQRHNPRLVAVRPLVVLSNLLNGGWILAWHYGLYPLSLAVMLGLLLTLIAVYNRLRVGLQPQRGAELWAVNLPFSVYLGWISVATIANATAVLWDLGRTRLLLGPELWTAVLVGVAAALGVAFVSRRRDVAYAAVLVWAIVGIAVKHPDIPLVALSAAIAAALLLVVMLVAPFDRSGRKTASD